MDHQYASITISDALIILSTIIGPVLAVQAQKWVERSRERRQRKERLFETLMSTRGDILQFEHKRALNMIDIVFTKDKEILDAWHNYLDTLSTQANDTNFQVVGASREQKFVAMIKAMATLLGYDFDEVMIKRGYYSPTAHGDFEEDHRKIRKGIISILEGQPLNMQTFLAINPEALSAQIELQKKLANAISDDGQLRVSTKPQEP